MNASRIVFSLGLVFLGLGAIVGPNVWSAPDESAVTAARRETKMLDTLYKTAIVAVTGSYVEDASSTAAATTFGPVFKAMREAKYHEVRLVDGLGEAINPDNTPRDDFEKEAMKAILAGKEIVDKVDSTDGVAYLRTMTVLPMAMEKCILCHENFRGKSIVGGMSYKLPIR
jgi:hypothetical protein